MNLALPMMVGSVIETVYNLTDAFFLGKLGTAQIGAPSISFSLVFFLIVFGMGLSGAGTTLISQSRGKNDAVKMNHYMNQLASLLTVASIVLSAIGVALAGPILRLLSTPEEVYGYAFTYMTIVFLGIPFMFVYFVLQASFTAVGDTVTPLKVHLLAIAVNVIMDPLLIFGLGPFPALGVAGAAIATVLSQGIGAVLALIVLARGKAGLRLSLAAMRPDRRAWGLLLKIGLPSSVGQALSAFGFTVLQGVVNRFGTAAIAAFGVGNRIMRMFDIPTQGMANATTSLVGKAMGARDHATVRRTVRSALSLIVVFEVPFLLLAFFFGGELVRLFVNDAEAIRLGDLMFKVVNPSLLMFGLYMALTGAFQGAGDTRIIMVLSVIRLWVIRVPLAYALAYLTDLGPLSIWIAMFVSNFLTATAGGLYFKSGRWKKALDPDTV